MERWARKTVAEWEEVFKAQGGSGVSAVEFCRRQEIPYTQFLYFRKKLKKCSGAQLMAITTVGGSVPALRRQGFVPVRIENGSAMRLKFPRGLVVESDGLLPVAWVTEAAERWLRMGK